MLSRRHFLRNSGLATAGLLINSGVSAQSAVTDNALWYMPDEGEPHARTWMAFGASGAIWGRELLPEVRRNLALIANTIVKYEPVSMLVREDELAIARQLLDQRVEIITSAMDDLWMRDTGPVFVVTESGKKASVDLNFNGWGDKQRYRQDALVATRVAKEASVSLINTPLTLEGGCIEVDGRGTAIITESCTLNNNRNPGVSRAQFEDLLMPLLGLEKIIWLPGIEGMDITDAHTDFYARFARPGVVLAGYEPDPELYDHELTLEHLEILQSATDARGRKLAVEVLEAPVDIREDFLHDDFASGYIGFYLCNGAVIMQSFGDRRADKKARDTLKRVFPERTVEMLNVDALAAGGGSIHCATQQEPMV